MIEVSTTLHIDELESLIRSAGGEVSWPKGAPSQKSLDVDVEVDEEEAANALPSGWFDHDEETEADRADARDVTDFVAACRRGDRTIVNALSPRIFATVANLDAVDRAIGHV